MIYAVKALIEDVAVATIDLAACKTMYAGKTIRQGDAIFLFANEQSPSAGLTGHGIVTAAEPLAKIPDVGRQTPRVSISVGSILRPKRALTRRDLISFKDYDDGRPQLELNFSSIASPPTRSSVYRTKRPRFCAISSEERRRKNSCDRMW